jgi:hypothetical protein
MKNALQAVKDNKISFLKGTLFATIVLDKQSNLNCDSKFFSLALGSTQPLTEMSTRKLKKKKKKKKNLGGKVRLARRADNLAAIYEPFV